MLSIAEGAYEERKEALTFVYKLCNNDREFTIGICAAGLLLPLANVIDTEMSDVSMMCLEILYMLGMACEEMAIDLTQCQGYEIIAKVLDKLLGVPESDEMNERIYDLLRYYYLDDENV
ncbi:hypothetical protein GPJ56_004877 [Histomonas meleagridis]|uniref:uncharacterized protein n=1 Tax=Histomonas meleagridis TaxID=135588 RepID=UPI00355A1AB2|nr:hypothetical protein GPJ56_004877 [Histomonas meleagridis]KAH0803527.1 hypothetical protein GO595_003871 [Histomonas meleagridis]